MQQRLDGSDDVWAWTCMSREQVNRGVEISCMFAEQIKYRWILICQRIINQNMLHCTHPPLAAAAAEEAEAEAEAAAVAAVAAFLDRFLGGIQDVVLFAGGPFK